MLKVLVANDKLLTIGYVGKIDADVGGVLFDGFFEGTIKYPNGDQTEHKEDDAILMREPCHMSGSFAGLVKSHVYDTEDDVPEIVEKTLDHLQHQENLVAGEEQPCQD